MLDKGVIGYEASSRNGGGVATRAAEPPVAPLGAESLRLWPTLHDDLGYPTEFRPGTIRVAMDEREFALMRASVFEGEGMADDAEEIDTQEIRELFPIINPEVPGGMYSGVYGQANPQRTVQAYAWAFQDHGGRIHQHTTVTGLTVEGGKVTAVETDRGTFGAGFVVDSAGPQTALIAEMAGVFVPVAPARVEIVVTAPIEFMWRGRRQRERAVRPADAAREPGLRRRQAGVDRRGPPLAGQAEHAADPQRSEAVGGDVLAGRPTCRSSVAGAALWSRPRTTTRSSK